jgi:phage-related protein
MTKQYTIHNLQKKTEKETDKSSISPFRKGGTRGILFYAKERLLHQG